MTLNDDRGATSGVRRPTSRDRRLGEDLREQILALVGEVERAVDRDLEIHPADHVDDAQIVLSRLWDTALEAMLCSFGTPSTASHQAQLAGLLTRIRNAESAVAEARIAESTAMLHSVRTALATIGDATTASSLLDRAAEAGCSLGFDRTLVSRVENSIWKPRAMCVAREPRWAEEILAVGNARPPELDGGIVETDIVEQAVSGLVMHVQDNPRVDRPLAEITRSTSYGVAPLIVNREVIGLVHCDRYHQRRDVNATDRALIALFTQGLGQAMGRAIVLDGVSALRSGVDQLTEAMTTVGGGGAPAIDPEHGRSGISPAPADNHHSLLTPREVEVVRLLAHGASNVAIGRRLVISEGTVKAHVTHILRKLGAANRAEAVSQWLRSTGCG